MRSPLQPSSPVSPWPWAVTSGQTLLDFQQQAAQGQLAQKAGQPSNIVYHNLQAERRLGAEALAHAREAPPTPCASSAS
ncbi:hypothetical protein OHR86_26220 [Streptomyces sp. NBC_00441]|uniref:hypothetical protein n=1 Tax=Streptomyces sp. NBC_00441 TaxID=2975742 RepID=UPI002E2C1ED2|nr:hypothetical protein [Streptomyces sp. NBC_00441]